MSQRENGQLPLAKPTVRSRIPSESWEQTKPPTHPASVCARVARNSRSHDAVIRVYDDAGDVIETHEHAGDFKDSFSSGFLTVLQKTSPATQQPMGLENRFDCHSSLQQKQIRLPFFPATEANCHESHSNSGSETASSQDYVQLHSDSHLDSYFVSTHKPRQLKPKTRVTCKTRKRKPKKRSKSVTSSQQKTPREGVCPRVFPRTLSRF